MYDSLHSCQLKSANGFPLWLGRCQGRRCLAFILTLDMYDSLHSCQLKSANGFPLWLGRCQGRRCLAFILTLDTDPATSTIGPGTKFRGFFLSFVP